VNLVILEGSLSRPAELRPLPSGSTLVALEVTVETERGPAESAPVVYFDAPAWVSSLPAKTPVLIVGRVRRRFFRSGAQTQSRTEVVAHRVIRQTSVTLARRALREAGVTVEDAAEQLGVTS
jgi:single-strand DNA-binding protein